MDAEIEAAGAGSDVGQNVGGDAGGSAESTTSPEPAPSLRESLSAAVDAVEGGDETAPIEKTAAERARDEAGRFAREQAKKTGQRVVPVKKGGTDNSSARTPATPGGSTPGASPVKTPAWVKPADRELWNAVPKQLQDAFAQREAAYAKQIGAHSQDVQVRQKFEQTMAPYMQHIQNEGGDPFEAIDTMMRTAWQIRQPHLAPAVIAQAIHDFNINPAAVAAYLRGQPMPQAQHPQQAQVDSEQIEQRILQRLAENRFRSTVETEAAHLEEFGATHEFFNDVRDTMADIVLLEAQKAKAEGRKPRRLDNEKLYEQACLLNEAVAPVYRQRQAAQAAGPARASVQRAQRAASSIRSSPAGGQSASTPTDRRGALAAAAESFGW